MRQFQLPAHRVLFYGGGWHQAAGGTAATLSPSSGQALGSFAVAGAEDVDRAVTAARSGFAEWRRVAPLERARVLREMARRLAACRDELAWIDAIDGGSPVRELRNDVDTAVAQLDFFAGLVTEMKGASVPMGPGGRGRGRHELRLVRPVLRLDQPSPGWPTAVSSSRRSSPT